MNRKLLFNLSKGGNVVFFILIYKLLLDWIYQTQVTPFWYYQGFVDNYSFLKYSLSLLFILLSAHWMNKYFKEFKPSSIMMIVFFLFYFIPLSTVYSFSGLSNSFYIYTMIYWLILNLLYNNLRFNFKFAQVRSKVVFYLFFYIIIILNLLFTIRYNGFNFRFSLQDAYDVRYAVREIKMPFIVGYIKPVASKLILIGVILSILKRKWILLAGFCIIQLLNFSFGALKSDLFSLFVALFIGFLYKENLKYWILYGMIILCGLSIVEYQLTDNYLIAAIFHRRVLYMSPLLTSQFYDFFSTNELVYLRDGFLGKLGFENPYNELIPRVIGESYYSSLDVNANTGICGDDFAQFGWASLVIYPLVRVWLFQLLDYVSSGLNIKLVLLISILYALSFISGSMTVILLTNGFLIVCILLFLLPRN